MEDLRPGRPLRLCDDAPAEDIFPWHKQLPAFEKVVFSQFEARLKDHRMAAAKDVHRATHPRQTRNEKGELVFDMHPAKLLSKEDIENKLHLTTHNAPGKLQASRVECKLFKPKQFGERTQQEIKLQKRFHCLKLRSEGVRNGKKKVKQTLKHWQSTHAVVIIVVVIVIDQTLIKWQRLGCHCPFDTGQW
jgi:hypothetical protein